MVRGWIFEENLRPVVQLLAGHVGYDFDDGDWAAIAFNPWPVQYDLHGATRVSLEISQEPGTSNVDLSVTADDETESSARCLVNAAQHYWLVRDRPRSE